MARICAVISAILCCICCSGLVCFLIFGGALFGSFFALYHHLKCSPEDLKVLEPCIAKVMELGNATLNFDPKFDDGAANKEIIELCNDALFCVRQSKCIGPQNDFYTLNKNRCEVYKFIQDEFAECADKLKREPKTTCTRLLFGGNKCGKWAENQECIEKEILENCGERAHKRYQHAAGAFMRAACEETITDAMKP